MRRGLLVFGVLIPLATVLPLLAQSREERAVRALVERVIQANNSVDEQVARQPLDDLSRNAGPFFPPFAVGAATGADLNPLLGQLLAQVSARSLSTTGPVTVRVDRNMAWAAYPWRAEMTFRDGTRRSLEGRTTITFLRDGKNWRISHWHSSLPAHFPRSAAALDAEGQSILKIERDAWEAVKNKQTDGLADYFAEDASVFDESQAYRLRGREEILRALDAWLHQSSLTNYQILDPQVQVLGDTALLTYYFSESGVSGGKDFSNAGKISMVFVKRDGRWRALHEHRSVNR
jgi:uncharacterized protein (TIGR02246 family)